MGYPIDLDEYEEKRLIDELARRAHLRAEGLCDYCERPSTKPACKFPGRHAGVVAVQILDAVAVEQVKRCGAALWEHYPTHDRFGLRDVANTRYIAWCSDFGALSDLVGLSVRLTQGPTIKETNMTMTITELVEESYRTSKEKGWHDEPERTFGEEIALVHSEASEALEEHRDGRSPTLTYFKEPQPPGVPYDTIEWAAQGNKPEGVGIELADIIIRVADMCKRHGVDLEQMIRVKQAYNSTRPRKHGGKKI